MPNQPGKVRRVLTDLIRLINEGEWGRSGILPSQIQLARKYEVATSTMNDVFALLRAQGYVVPEGRNVRVTTHRIALPTLVPSFDKYLEERGLAPFMQNIGDIEVVELSKELAEAFELPQRYQAIKSLRLQGEKEDRTTIPYRLTETYYPYDLAHLYIEEIRKNPDLNVKDEIGKPITHSHVSVLTRIPNEQEQELLDITIGTFVNEVFRKSFTEDNTLIMFSRIISPNYRFKLTFQENTSA
jgi:DNA-binding GntR family transcriptional regulator